MRQEYDKDSRRERYELELYNYDKESRREIRTGTIYYDEGSRRLAERCELEMRTASRREIRTGNEDSQP